MKTRLTTVIAALAIAATACGGQASEDIVAGFDVAAGDTTSATAAPASATVAPEPIKTPAPEATDTGATTTTTEAPPETTTTTTAPETTAPSEPFDPSDILLPPHVTPEILENAADLGVRYVSPDDNLPLAITLNGITEVDPADVPRGRTDYRYVVLDVTHENLNPDSNQSTTSAMNWQWIGADGYVAYETYDACFGHGTGFPSISTEAGTTQTGTVCLAIPAASAEAGWVRSNVSGVSGIWNVTGALPAASAAATPVECGTAAESLALGLDRTIEELIGVFGNEFALDPTIDPEDFDGSAFALHQVALRMQHLGTLEGAAEEARMQLLDTAIDGRAAAEASADAMRDTGKSIDDIVATIVDSWTPVAEAIGEIPDPSTVC